MANDKSKYFLNLNFFLNFQAKKEKYKKSQNWIRKISGQEIVEGSFNFVLLISSYRVSQIFVTL